MVATARFSCSLAFNGSTVICYVNKFTTQISLRPQLTRAERVKCVLIAAGNLKNKLIKSMVAPARFERAIFGLGNRCSILLSYEAAYFFDFYETGCQPYTL